MKLFIHWQASGKNQLFVARQEILKIFIPVFQKYPSIHETITWTPYVDSETDEADVNCIPFADKLESGSPQSITEMIFENPNQSILFLKVVRKNFYSARLITSVKYLSSSKKKMLI